ncbi:polyprenol phosphomannose-dependent alpha 1,6 mannosyltransferase MptB [Spirosoma sp. SC4-14]|uniref:polyprenol phosphomannose-dependent alpha 1,6 mannosyltransferase MptB n=1 Tax=Spirosoma sp. SC4-14 TaxID=3128900 RepID=UPI0030CF4244
MTTGPVRFVWLIGSAVLYWLLAYTVSRQQFATLFGLLTVLFAGYGWMLFSTNRFAENTGLRSETPKPDTFLFSAAILFRVLLLFSVPQLSDDVYRFIWDGRLLAHGFNPYLYLPSRIVGTDIATMAGLDQSLFQHLNSPAYFTVYPPANQALFGLAALLSPNSLLGTIVWLRMPILLSEAGTLWLMTRLLRRFGYDPNRALLYGLNPLVVLELTGNLHFEAVMIFFTALAIWWLTRQRDRASSGALALSVGTKLLPLIALPTLVRKLGWKRGVIYSVLTGVFTLVQFLPFASWELAQNMASSVNLYFQKFEFNASVYYVLRAVGYWVWGYNAIGFIGFWLSIITAGCIFWISFRWRNVSVPSRILAILTLYLAFATTVHPWYITTLVAVSVFTRFRYPLVWSALIPLSYFTYQTMPYQENLWLTALEYGIVGTVLLVEIGLRRR